MITGKVHPLPGHPQVSSIAPDKLHVRVGGIYALERIARDSARDHPTVMEVLAAFIREPSHVRRPPSGPGGQQQTRSIGPDVQAALTVVRRRDAERDIGRIDLTGAKLTGAKLTGAHLSYADLAGADLTGADLTLADLTGADLTGAELRSADLTDAKLGSAYFANADLHFANLRFADVGGADLTGADLADASWPRDTRAPEGWRRVASTGRLERSGTATGQAEVT
jgi:hypothetical protein